MIQSKNLSQLIDELTHIINDSSSCIDLIITSQPFLFVEDGIHPSLFKNCHHKIVHGKLNLSVPPPPVFKPKLWDYNNADIDALHNKLRCVDWYAVFSGLDVNMMVKTFNDLVLTAIADSIPNKLITCNSNDPPWIAPEIKTAIKRKHKVYKKYVSRGRKIDELAYMRVVRNETTHLIDRAKEQYFEKLGKKLSDPSTGTKSYWITLKNILNKKKNSVIPPLLENGVFITDFQAKADIFNELFVEQCSIVPNNSVVPPLIFRTNNELSNIAIDEIEILKLIRKLNSNKAHGWDELSIKMIKLCDNTIVLPLLLVYEKCLATGTYPQIWKMANVLPIHKKESRQIKKKIIARSHFSLFVEKYLKRFFLIKSITTCVIMNYSRPINLDFVQAIQL